ncbi:MAG: Methyltransferase FkbM family [Nitrospira sp.]|nr:MAG: Methyltransferase FkbM family [Nitrospira sp.]
MNTGIWLFFEVIFDTLMFAPYVLRGHFSARVKTQVLLTYLRLTVKLLLVHPFRPIRKERVLGFTVHCFDYRTMHLLFRVILLRNEYYFETAKAYPVIFDCGANIGLATLFFKWLYPGSEIYAFEPDGETFALLRRNVEANNLTGVHLYNAALSDKAGTASFYVDHSKPGSPRMSLNYQRMPKDSIVVETLILSDIIRSQLAGKELDFLKIDVEGAEEAVLKDLVDTEQLGPVRELLIEFHHKIAGARGKLGPFLSELEKQGFDYQLDAVCMPIYSPGRFQNVILYVYRSRPAEA